MHRTDSSFRRHPGGGSLRRFSFRRKPTRESIHEPTSTWSFNTESHEWQLLRGNIRFIFFSFHNHLDKKYAFMRRLILSFCTLSIIICTRLLSLLFFISVFLHALVTHSSTFPGHYSPG
jgi:hypothetical protein